MMKGSLPQNVMGRSLTKLLSEISSNLFLNRVSTMVNRQVLQYTFSLPFWHPLDLIPYLDFIWQLEFSWQDNSPRWVIGKKRIETMSNERLILVYKALLPHFLQSFSSSYINFLLLSFISAYHPCSGASMEQHTGLHLGTAKDGAHRRRIDKWRFTS